MPRNGSGSYNLPNGPFVPSTVISSTVMNQNLNDLGTALTQSIANDGQTTPVANLPMATFRHTNVGNAVARNDYAAAGQVQDSVLMWLTSIAGTDTITASITPSPTVYTAGQTFRLVPAGTNTTGTVTLNINGLGAKAITKNGTVALAPGDLIAGKVYEVVYDGTQFQLLTDTANASVTTDSNVQRLVALNNAGTPTTKMDMSAESVTLKGSSTIPAVTRFGVSTITNDIGLAGPAVNGRDVAGAFGATAEVHFYFIWNGTTMATVSSTVAPPTGPTLPTGYTHWAYAFSVKLSASVLLSIHAFGQRVFYDNPPSLGTPNTTTTGSFGTFVPSYAESWSWSGTFALNADGSGNAYATLGIDSGLTNQGVIQFGFSGLGAGGATGPMQGRWTDLPNMPAQVISWVITVAAGSSPATTNFVVDYVVPNS